MINDKITNYLKSEPIFRTDIFYWFLFHGTRRYTLECSKEERQAIFEASKIVNKYADSIINSGDISPEKRGDISLFPTVPSGKEEGDDYYQYGDFYLTNSFKCAVEDYSNNCGGEYMQLAYNNASGLIALGYELPDDVKKAFKFIESVYPKFAQSERIVIAINGVEYKDLLNENGSEIHPANIKDPYRYVFGDFGFRLLNPDKYKDRFYIISEADFDYYTKAFNDFAEMMKEFRDKISFKI